MNFDVNLINPFLGATKSVLGTAANLNISIGKPTVKKTEFSKQSLLITLGITGQVEGQVIMDIPETSAVKIASAFMQTMMGMTVESLDEMSISAISELGNQIMGNAATIFSTQNTLIDITPPTLIRGEVTFSRDYALNIAVPIIYENETLFELNMAVKSK